MRETIDEEYLEAVKTDLQGGLRQDVVGMEEVIVSTELVPLREGRKRPRYELTADVPLDEGVVFSFWVNDEGPCRFVGAVFRGDGVEGWASVVAADPSRLLSVWEIFRRVMVSHGCLMFRIDNPPDLVAVAMRDRGGCVWDGVPGMREDSCLSWSAPRGR